MLLEWPTHCECNTLGEHRRTSNSVQKERVQSTSCIACICIEHGCHDQQHRRHRHRSRFLFLVHLCLHHHHHHHRRHLLSLSPSPSSLYIWLSSSWSSSCPHPHQERDVIVVRINVRSQPLTFQTCCHYIIIYCFILFWWLSAFIISCERLTCPWRWCRNVSRFLLYHPKGVNTHERSSRKTWCESRFAYVCVTYHPHVAQTQSGARRSRSFYTMYICMYAFV